MQRLYIPQTPCTPRGEETRNKVFLDKEQFASGENYILLFPRLPMSESMSLDD